MTIEPTESGFTITCDHNERMTLAHACLALRNSLNDMIAKEKIGFARDGFYNTIKAASEMQDILFGPSTLIG